MKTRTVNGASMTVSKTIWNYRKNDAFGEHSIQSETAEKKNKSRDGILVHSDGIWNDLEL